MTKIEKPANAPGSKATPLARVSRDPSMAVYNAIQHLMELVKTFRTFHKPNPPRA